MISNGGAKPDSQIQTRPGQPDPNKATKLFGEHMEDRARPEDSRRTPKGPKEDTQDSPVRPEDS